LADYSSLLVILYDVQSNKKYTEIKDAMCKAKGFGAQNEKPNVQIH
jgi:hypothetical protein